MEEETLGGPVAPSLFGSLATVRPPSGPPRAIDRPMIVGSAEAADLRVDDRTVSRVHAELIPRADGLWVRDLGSKNGTVVEGLRVEAARVPHGGHVVLGGATLVVTYGAGPESPSWPASSYGRLVGRSARARALFSLLDKVARSEGPVLVLGETGTGKELVADAIHRGSARATGPFVVVDCGALPESILDAELFGHAKGAFTGATGVRLGAFEAADGGTIFLDEIGELPLSVQPKLLRVLESGAVRRLGENEHRPIDVRIVAATHRDLSRMVADGTFREDLYFRLAVFPVHVPPLRERREDIGPLLAHFLGPDAPRVAPELLAEIEARPFRGNVRELRNLAERVRTLGVTAALDATTEALPAPTTTASGAPRVTLDVPFDDDLRLFRAQLLEAAEAEYVRILLERHEGNVTHAARAAGVARTYLHRLLRRAR